jgi:hypothetical protein
VELIFGAAFRLVLSEHIDLVVPFSERVFDFLGVAGPLCRQESFRRRMAGDEVLSFECLTPLKRYRRRGIDRPFEEFGIGTISVFGKSSTATDRASED